MARVEYQEPAEGIEATGEQQMMTSWQACEVLFRPERRLPSAPEGTHAAPDFVARFVCACPCGHQERGSALKVKLSTKAPLIQCFVSHLSSMCSTEGSTAGSTSATTRIGSRLALSPFCSTCSQGETDRERAHYRKGATIEVEAIQLLAPSDWLTQEKRADRQSIQLQAMQLPRHTCKPMQHPCG